MKENIQQPNSNPFKILEGNEDAPDGLKRKVMASINFSNMLLDVGELFTINLANSLGVLFKITQPEDTPPPNENGLGNKTLLN